MSLYGSCKSIGAWGSDNIYMSGQANIPDMQSARRDMVTGSVVVAAIVMFIWTGGSAMSAVVRRLTGLGAGVEQIMMTALLLNIALILFGWRRYRDLQIEVKPQIGRASCMERRCTYV